MLSLVAGESMGRPAHSSLPKDHPPAPAELDRLESLANAYPARPLARELMHMVTTCRGLVDALQLLACELEGEE
jgi:hypothetical protein